MPSRAGTLAERRTQLDLRCGRCRHEWSIEMTPPVLIVKPDRETDSETFRSQPPITKEPRTRDRRESYGSHRQRMRVGLRGLLTSTDRTQTVTVLYSLNAHRVAGRLRLMDPSSVSPPWLVAGSRLWLSGYDGLRLRIRITVVKLRGEGCKDDDHFAEFVVPQITQATRAGQE